MQDKEFTKERGATTATTLRLCKPWKGSGRIVVGDIRFGSVETAIQMMTKMGIFYWVGENCT